MEISVFDIDKTLSVEYYVFKFPRVLCKAGLFSQKEQKIMEKNLARHVKLGEAGYPYEQFAWDTVNTYGRGIKGRPVKAIIEQGKQYIREHQEEYFSFTRSLIELVKSKGQMPIIISGSPIEVVEPFAESLGIDIVFATTYEVNNWIYTGKPINNGAIMETKRRMPGELLSQNKVDLARSSGFGDSYHDTAFLEIVGKPVAIHPDSALEKLATQKDWLICKEDDKVLKLVSAYLSKPIPSKKKEEHYGPRIR